MEGITGMYIVEIPPRSALTVERHLYEENFYVFEGKGVLEAWTTKNEKQSCPWGPGSLFAVPLNTWHRIANESNSPALLLAGTNAPIVLDIFYNRDFVFNCDFDFVDRFDGEGNFFEPSDAAERASLIIEKNLIPDIRKAKLAGGNKMGEGYALTFVEMAGNVLISHLAELPVKRRNMAHSHGGGAVLLCLQSKGYTLMWPTSAGIPPYEAGNADKVVKIHWKEGGLASPPTNWFHTHFNVGREPVRLLAIRNGSKKRGVAFYDVHAIGGSTTPIKQGGTMLEFEDEDPQINKDFRSALKNAGIS
jgi:hypothetical protein